MFNPLDELQVYCTAGRTIEMSSLKKKLLCKEELVVRTVWFDCYERLALYSKHPY